MWKKLCNNFAVIGFTFFILGATVIILAPSIRSFILGVGLMIFGQLSNKIETLGWPNHNNFYKDKEDGIK